MPPLVLIRLGGLKYGPGKQAVPDVHSSGFNLLSTLGCGCVGIPFLYTGRGLGRSDAKQHKGQAYEFGGACLHVRSDSLTLVTVKKLC